MEPTEEPKARGSAIKRFMPLIIIGLGIVLFFVFGLDRYLRLEALKENHEALRNFVDTRWWAPALFVLLYAVIVAFSIPLAAIMTPTAGLLFGVVEGSIYSVVGATLGATGIFLVAKYALGDFLREKAGPFIKKLEAGFREDAFSYLMVLRFVPLVPFWVVNLVPAFLGVKLVTFIITTLIGIIPGAVVYATVGASFSSLIAQGEDLTLQGALTPQVIGALVGLALLSCVPIVYKRIMRRRDAAKTA